MTEPIFTPEQPACRSRWQRPATAWSMLLATVVVTAAVLATGAPATAGSDEQGVQQVVQTQLQALASADAVKAYDLADAGLRTQFGSAEAFLASVRADYPMMAHPASVLFLKPQSDGTIALQKVRVTDSQGANWVVTYLLNRQHDHQWRISGCLVEADGAQVIA